MTTAITSEGVTLKLSGEWTTLYLDAIETILDDTGELLEQAQIICDLEAVRSFDTAGALMLLRWRDSLEETGTPCTIQIPNTAHHHLFELVAAHRPTDAKGAEPVPCSFFSQIGRWTLERIEAFGTVLTFIGYAALILLSYARRLKSIRYREIVFEMNESAIKALGVVGLINFLVGVVIAYQSSLQLKLYGANIFIVDMLGIGILRELAPMLVAVVVAGRSGSAYAAQIGVMKITEELDAMRTMGFDPYAFLVVPRLIALMLMMPLLIFFADIMGIFGGMMVANAELDIEFGLFIERFATVVDINHFWVGMVKGPFFALLIASIGIYRGLQVQNDTQSIGFNTTKSVVEAIFAVIICDAVFSIIFTNLGI